jgi:hypothetical protein
MAPFPLEKGYEATFGPPSFMALETGGLLADLAIALVRGG